MGMHIWRLTRESNTPGAGDLTSECEYDKLPSDKTVVITNAGRKNGRDRRRKKRAKREGLKIRRVRRGTWKS